MLAQVAEEKVFRKEAMDFPPEELEEHLQDGKLVAWDENNGAYYHLPVC